jgi:phosphoserine phosphatase
MFVLNVIGKGANPALFQSAFSAATPGTPVFLSPGYAFDIPFSGDGALVLAAARALGGAFDVNVVAAAQRRKKLLIADKDSNIKNVECQDELADMANLKPRIAAITERAMRGELEFESALRERVGMLKGLPLSALARTYEERVRLNPGAKRLLATMRAHGAHSLLEWGGITRCTSRVAREAGFDEHQGNTLLDDGAALTGAVGEPILGREAKLAALESAVKKLGIGFADTLAVGDGANDLAMIRRAGENGGLGVAYHAKPVVAAAAGAAIRHGDLTALLYLQGYSDAQIASI